MCSEHFDSLLQLSTRMMDPKPELRPVLSEVLRMVATNGVSHRFIGDFAHHHMATIPLFSVTATHQWTTASSPCPFVRRWCRQASVAPFCATGRRPLRAFYARHSRDGVSVERRAICRNQARSRQWQRHAQECGCVRVVVELVYTVCVCVCVYEANRGSTHTHSGLKLVRRLKWTVVRRLKWTEISS